jgi:acyl carrier protein
VTGTGLREALREWIVKTSGRIDPETLRDDTPILEQRILTSLHVLELVLFLEQVTGRPIDVHRLQPGVFRDVETICRTFAARTPS